MFSQDVSQTLPFQPLWNMALLLPIPNTSNRFGPHDTTDHPDADTRLAPVQRASTSSCASCASWSYASGTADTCTVWQIAPMSPDFQASFGYLRSIALRN